MPGLPEDRRRGALDDPDERARFAGLLAAGAVVLASDVLDMDERDPARGRIVPSTVRTDGAWLWTDRLTYYVREHGLAPQPEMRRHLAGPPPGPVTPERLDEIRAAMAYARPELPAPGPDARPLRGAATYRGRLYLDVVIREGDALLGSADPSDLALGFDPCSGFGERLRVRKTVPREELSGLFRRCAWVVVQGVRFPVDRRGADGVYAIPDVPKEHRHLLGNVRELDRGWWVADVRPEDADDFFHEEEHLPVGPGWREREPWSVRLPGA
ncbi:hypothetical protein [Actinomadura violacea]|uniref:Uncharacterized protein n=1 Tax=Actinomadura violacea TaxID=2819934 RepID=A0ABS3S2Y7_9ACTN|nr:hypothetical protein [Actinomadura violacea]MBO2463362.1 hypothetical protein [Actinomadura violacea]